MSPKQKDNSANGALAAEQTDTERTLLVEGAVASDEDRARLIAQKHDAEKEVKRILVVDDEPDIVTVIGKSLRDNGYEVIAANDGQEALEKAKAEKPDLILLDLMLPIMDGYKVCGLLKNDTRYSKIPVILFTAKAQEKDIKLGEEVGADAYITKPFEPEVLFSKIKELIKK